MDERRQQELRIRIAQAKERRQSLGLTKEQIEQLGKPLKPKRVVRSDLSRKRSNRPQLREAPQRRNSVFLTGGIGDIFAVESFLTDVERESLVGIYYATSKQKMIEELWRSLPNYPNLKVHSNVWSDFSAFWCFCSLGDCCKFLKNKNVKEDPNLSRVRDLSIIPFFERVKRGQFKYNNSSFLIHKLCDVNHLQLPERYVAVCPYSSDKRLAGRDFSSHDWSECLAHLKQLGVVGVVLNQGDDAVPVSEQLVDMTNKTTIVEAVEVLKGAEGYVGIDSSLSVLAAKLFKYPRLMIKSINNHCYQNISCYYAPCDQADFLMKSIRCPVASIHNTRKEP